MRVKTRAPPMPPRSSQNRRAGGQALVVGGEPGEPERRVRLERGREVRLAAPVDRPEPVGPLAREQLVHAAAGRLLVAEAQELEQQQVLRRHGHVGLELADPPAVGPLQREEPPGRPAERPLELARGRLAGRLLAALPGGAHVVTLSSHSARHARAFPRYARKRVEGGVPHRLRKCLTLALRAGRVEEEPGGGAAAPDRALHRRRPARVPSTRRPGRRRGGRSRRPAGARRSRGGRRTWPPARGSRATRGARPARGARSARRPGGRRARGRAPRAARAHRSRRP